MALAWHLLGPIHASFEKILSPDTLNGGANTCNPVLLHSLEQSH
jgi:hypothetical protein